MTIPIHNLYYMLCYAWNRLEEGEIIPVGQVDKDEVSQLFAKVLLEGTFHLFKRGLDRGYVSYSDEIQRIRGKIDFYQNIKRNFCRQPRLYCHYDEFDYDILHNQILKATIKNMIGCKGLKEELKEQLKSLVFRLHNVSDLFLRKTVFRQVQLHRNNSFYDFMIKVCELIYDNLLILKDGKGRRFRDFVQDEKVMSIIFEEFVRNFYERHLANYQVRRSYIEWQLEPISDGAKAYLPRMETDITLLSTKRKKKIIIDTKYYNQTLSSGNKIRSDNLYQLFAYVKNQEGSGPFSMQCDGILLYPAVDRGYNLSYKIDGHKIFIRTINLNQDWRDIEKDLLAIVKEAGEEEPPVHSGAVLDEAGGL